MDTAPRTRRRALRAVAAVFGGGLLLSVVPVPAPSFLPTAVTEVAFLPLDREVGASEGLAGDRVKGTATGVESFDTVGVVLDDAPSVPVMVRVQSPEGEWGEWNELSVATDMGPDPASREADGPGDPDRTATEPIWVGDAQGYEVSVGAGDADGVEVVVVREETRRVLVDSVSLAEAAAPAPFGINSRASWGARAPASTPSLAPAIKLAVVHHTASSNDYTASQVPGILRSIQAYHMDGNGWSGMAYNFLVDKFGGIWEGRAGGTGSPVIGAHAKGFNTGSVGVAVLGNYVDADSSSAARESVSRIVGYRLHDDGVDPASRVNVTSLGSTTIPANTVVNLPAVVGHRDIGSTACPGSLYGSLASMRNRAKEWYLFMETVTTPTGAIDSVRVDGSSVDVIGWARDGDVPEVPSRVHVVMAGRLSEAVAEGYRPDVGRAYAGFGDNRGFNAGFRDVDAGTHRVCVTVINEGLGRNKLLGCRDVVVK